MIRLEIPEVPPSANVLMRLHWAKRRRLIQSWQALIVYGDDSPLAQREWALHVGKNRPKVKVTITRYSPRLIDQANCWLPYDKLVLDNLVKLGLMIDDSPKWMECEIKQEKSKERKTVVEVREA